ncbi:glycosyltransferase, partial [Candidatus Saccharibacteria bacterium]|nr:glycosyltransferase [Candidatus Saccharibacteria bacterium]
MQEVFYDLRFVRTDYHDGISRFSFELAKAYLKMNPKVVFLSTRKSYKRHAEMLDLSDYEIIEEGSKLRPFEDNQVRFCLMNDPEDGLKELRSHKRLERFIPDDYTKVVVYTPMQTLRPSPKYKLILSLHDTIYYKFPAPPKNHPWFVRIGWRLFYSLPLWQRLILNKADALVTVSKTSEQEIRRLRLTDKPIYVVYNAPPSDFVGKKPLSPIKKVDNLLYVGSSVPYKNIKTLINAMHFLPEKKLYLAILNMPKNVRAELKRL